MNKFKQNLNFWLSVNVIKDIRLYDFTKFLHFQNSAYHRSIILRFLQLQAYITPVGILFAAGSNHFI